MTKKTSYGIIETIGGLVMARIYRHIQQYEREIPELKEKGMTQKEIAQQLGFTKEQVKEFFHRQHKGTSKNPFERKRTACTNCFVKSPHLAWSPRQRGGVELARQRG